jgi:hypothetical protein
MVDDRRQMQSVQIATDSRIVAAQLTAQLAADPKIVAALKPWVKVEYPAVAYGWVPDIVTKTHPYYVHVPE